MIRGKLIDWITYVLNMLAALPVFGLISCAIFWFAYPFVSPSQQSAGMGKMVFPDNDRPGFNYSLGAISIPHIAFLKKCKRIFMLFSGLTGEMG